MEGAPTLHKQNSKPISVTGEAISSRLLQGRNGQIRILQSTKSELQIPPTTEDQDNTAATSQKAESEPVTAKKRAKRSRTRCGSFYGVERPIINEQKQVIHINKCILPTKSCSYSLLHDSIAELMSGEDFVPLVCYILYHSIL